MCLLFYYLFKKIQKSFLEEKDKILIYQHQGKPKLINKDSLE